MARSINFKFPFVRSPQGGFASNKTTIDAVKDDLKILILTNYGERPIHADFGANLRSVIFEQGDDVRQKVKDAIVSATGRWLPAISLLDVQVDDSTTKSTIVPNQIKVTIRFSVGQQEGILEQTVKA